MIIVSACLAGLNCKYNGENNRDERIVRLVQQGKAIPLCPEQLGGLSTPREPAEIRGGSGEDVLTGKAKIYTPSDADVTAAFIKGAGEVLKLAQEIGVQAAILKEKSPSCGSSQIYDGSFSGITVPGKGVTAALLQRNGLKVMSEKVREPF